MRYLFVLYSFFFVFEGVGVVLWIIGQFGVGGVEKSQLQFQLQ